MYLKTIFICQNILLIKIACLNYRVNTASNFFEISKEEVSILFPSSPVQVTDLQSPIAEPTSPTIDPLSPKTGQRTLSAPGPSFLSAEGPSSPVTELSSPASELPSSTSKKFKYQDEFSKFLDSASKTLEEFVQASQKNEPKSRIHLFFEHLALKVEEADLSTTELNHLEFNLIKLVYNTIEKSQNH